MYCMTMYSAVRIMLVSNCTIQIRSIIIIIIYYVIGNVSLMSTVMVQCLDYSGEFVDEEFVETKRSVTVRVYPLCTNKLCCGH